MIGLAQIPYTAAKDGYFYAFLAHEHETYQEVYRIIPYFLSVLYQPFFVSVT